MNNYVTVACIVGITLLFNIAHLFNSNERSRNRYYQDAYFSLQDEVISLNGKLSSLEDRIYDLEFTRISQSGE